MSKDIYTTFIGAKGVAFAWIGAAIAPPFLVIGTNPEYRSHLAVGIAALVAVLLSVINGAKGLKAKSTSYFLVYTLIPFAFFISSSLYTWLSTTSSS
ncbi:MAG: hypothetical protein MI754_15730 [Chromatiales bacterium]|nr:hypothetical protein [Chromatiales bacterium]